MIIKLILIVGFLVFILRFLVNTSSKAKAWQKILGILFVLVAIFVIMFPNTTNDIAHKVGVSRGADLLLYLLTLAFIFVCLNLYLKEKQDQRKIVELTRKIALLEARQRQTSKR